MSDVITFADKHYERGTAQVCRIAQEVIDWWISAQREPGRMVDVVGVAISKHIADQRGLKGDLSRVDEAEREMLTDLEDDVELLLRRLRKAGIHRKRVLECLGLIRMCCRATDLVHSHAVDKDDAVQIAGSEAVAIAEFIENDVNEPFFARPPTSPSEER